MPPPAAPRPPIVSSDPPPAPRITPHPVVTAEAGTPVEAAAPERDAPAIEGASPAGAAPARGDDARPREDRPRRTNAQPPVSAQAPAPGPDAPAPNGHQGENGDAERGATAPQLRRFIKSRAYVPMHELRRRFAINGADDEVTAVDLERRRVFVGLPEREGRLLGELLRGGDIGYELSLDPITPIVVGVYPMRPVTRA